MRLRTVLFTTYAALSAAYLAWRAGFTFHPERPVYSLVFYLAEALSVLASLVFYTLIVRRPVRRDDAPPDAWPSVDVVIATYNEDSRLVRTTALAARDMDGPHRTWICDDGRRPAVEALAAELGVGYLARADNRHHKAGNLNHALARTAGEFVLVLDADHVPRRQMIARLLGPFRDPRVALVQSPQVYYNIDSYQHAVSIRGRRLWHEASIFHHMMQPGADRLNAAFFVGTGALLRRSALEEVGGFATGSITEDIHTSLRLHAAGYRTAYVDEALGFLLAPDTPAAYAQQRLRWAQGAMQILRRENPARARGLGFWQRIGYLNSLGVYLAAYQHLVFYVAPGLYLFAGIAPIAVDPGVGFAFFAARIGIDLAIYKILAAPHGRLFVSECFKMLNVPIFIRASAALLKPGGLAFRVTPKGRHGGLPMWMVATAAALFLFNLTAVGVGLTRLVAGGPHVGALLLTTFFSAFFSVAGALALLHAWERRRAEESFAFPAFLRSSVTLEDGALLDVDVPRISRETAWVAADRSLPRGARVRMRLDVPGLGRPIDAIVEGADPAAAPPPRQVVLKLAFAGLLPAEIDALERYLFGTALPRFFSGFVDAPPGPPPDPPGREPLTDLELREFLSVRTGLV